MKESARHKTFQLAPQQTFRLQPLFIGDRYILNKYNSSTMFKSISIVTILAFISNVAADMATCNNVYLEIEGVMEWSLATGIYSLFHSDYSS